MNHSESFQPVCPHFNVSSSRYDNKARRCLTLCDSCSRTELPWPLKLLMEVHMHSIRIPSSLYTSKRARITGDSQSQLLLWYFTRSHHHRLLSICFIISSNAVYRIHFSTKSTAALQKESTFQQFFFSLLSLT